MAKKPDEPVEPVVPVEPTDPVTPPEPPEPTPPVEPTEPVEPVEPVEPEPPVEEEPPAPPSRREQLRIQDVLEKMKQGQQPTPATPPAPTPGGLDYSKALDADPEVIKQLEADRQAAINAAVQENNSQLQSYRWEAMVNLDTPVIEQKYPYLDKSSSEYHPALSDALNQMYFQLSGFKLRPDNSYTVANPGIRWKDFVEGYFETVDEIANIKTAATRQNITKQAAQTGIRPTGGTGKRLNLNQSPNQMSDEELKAKIEQDFQALGLS